MKSFLCAVLFIVTLQLSAQTKTDSTPEPRVIYAVKANGFVWQMPRYGAQTITAYGVDYSLYVQCDRTGLFIGYTPLYLTTKSITEPITLNAVNFGIQYKLIQYPKKQALYLCLYDVRSTQYSKNLLPYRSNLICFSPRYRFTFCKNILSAEIGLTAGFSIDRNLAMPGGRGYNFNLNAHYGGSVGLAFNFGALVKRRS